MQTYQEIKGNHQKEIDGIITKNQVFFAFSKSQLEEGKAKTNIAENKDLISIGAGGFIPKINADLFFQEMEQADQRYKKELKEAKDAQESAILYELYNHEAFYTQSINDVVELFDGVYTRDEVKKVFNKNNK